MQTRARQSVEMVLVSRGGPPESSAHPRRGVLEEVCPRDPHPDPHTSPITSTAHTSVPSSCCCGLAPPRCFKSLSWSQSTQRLLGN